MNTASFLVSHRESLLPELVINFHIVLLSNFSVKNFFFMFESEIFYLREVTTKLCRNPFPPPSWACWSLSFGTCLPVPWGPGPGVGGVSGPSEPDAARVFHREQ